MAAHFWIELHDANDIDLFVGVELWRRENTSASKVRMVMVETELLPVSSKRSTGIGFRAIQALGSGRSFSPSGHRVNPFFQEPFWNCRELFLEKYDSSGLST